MEALSVAASVVGLLEAAGKMSKTILSLTQKYHYAPKSIRDIQLEVCTIRTTLDELQAFLLRKSKVGPSQAAELLVDQVVVVLAGCVTTFSELDTFTKSLSKVTILFRCWIG